MSTNRVVNFGLVVFALSLAQFIMTIDTTIMNVSVPTLVNDLETTVGAVQGAIALYALVMAAFMLLGSKLGEIYGRKKIFQIGLVIYAFGSAITAAAPNIGVLMLGWSVLEGIGASLMMPAMMALISINFQGKQRVSALGIVAGVAGAAAALGPIVGGALSTYASWRYAFLTEVVIAIITLVLSKKILDSTKVSNEKIDWQGSTLVASGMALFVYGVLQASEYGWVRASKPFEVAGLTIAPFGLSIVLFLCGLGALLLWLFLQVETARRKANKPVLLNVSLLDIIPIKTGLTIVLVTQLALGGTLFVLPLFLQLVLGFSAMQTGVAMLPVSVALVATSILSNRLSEKFGTIRVIRTSQVILVFSLVLLAINVTSDTVVSDLLIPFTLFGAAIGVIMPLNQSILLGSAATKDSSQVAGLNYTYQQLGMSLGTAVIGSVLLFSLGNNIVAGLETSPQFDAKVVEAQSVQISSNVEFVSNEQLEAALKEADDLTESQKNTIIAVNEEARLTALRVAIAAAAVLTLLSIQSSGRMKDALKE